MWKRRLPTLWVLAVVGMAGAAVWLLATDRFDDLRKRDPVPEAVPAGDVEMAWLHTSTNGTTWERFVKGLMELDGNRGLTVDDAGAFKAASTETPEVVLFRASRPERRLRIRWYQLTSDWTAEKWVRAWEGRTPPLAFIGGGTSDRAKELAEALQEQHKDVENGPLLFITTATATGLTRIYPDRTFRFCFDNRRMAEAVVAFTRQTQPNAGEVGNFSVLWEDDPYSRNLHDCFRDVLGAATPLRNFPVRHSIGGALQPNLEEAHAVAALAKVCSENPTQPVRLILPGVTQPSRRVLRALLERVPTLRDRLTVLTGDGIPVNALIRDSSFAWPFPALPVPLILFAHNDPFDRKLDAGTEDVVHFKELGSIVAEALFGADGDEPAADPEQLRSGLRARRANTFDRDGERAAGSGEFVVHLRAVGAAAQLTAHRHEAGGAWLEQATVDIRGTVVRRPEAK